MWTSSAGCTTRNSRLLTRIKGCEPTSAPSSPRSVFNCMRMGVIEETGAAQHYRDCAHCGHLRGHQGHTGDDLVAAVPMRDGRRRA